MGVPFRRHSDKATPFLCAGCVAAVNVTGSLNAWSTALTLALELPVPEAIGTSLLVIAINAAVALSTRLATTSIDRGIPLPPFVIAAIAGVLTGGRRRSPRRATEPSVVCLAPGRRRPVHRVSRDVLAPHPALTESANTPTRRASERSTRLCVSVSLATKTSVPTS